MEYLASSLVDDGDGNIDEMNAKIRQPRDVNIVRSGTTSSQDSSASPKIIKR